MKTTLMLSLCAVLASPAFAADDPVTARQAIFKQFKKTPPPWARWQRRYLQQGRVQQAGHASG
jgi:cytochrome c556